jgi:hypothetical protein
MSEVHNYVSLKALRILANTFEIPIEPFQADKLGAEALVEIGALDMAVANERRAYVMLPVHGLLAVIQARHEASLDARAEQVIDVVNHGGVAKVDYGRFEVHIAAAIASAQSPNVDPIGLTLQAMDLRVFAGSVVLAGLVHDANLLPNSSVFREFEAALSDRGLYVPEDGGVELGAMSQIGSALVQLQNALDR